MKPNKTIGVVAIVAGVLCFAYGIFMLMQSSPMIPLFAIGLFAIAMGVMAMTKK